MEFLCQIYCTKSYMPTVDYYMVFNLVTSIYLMEVDSYPGIDNFSLEALTSPSNQYNPQIYFSHMWKYRCGFYIVENFTIVKQNENWDVFFLKILNAPEMKNYALMERSRIALQIFERYLKAITFLFKNIGNQAEREASIKNIVQFERMARLGMFGG